MPMDDPMMGGGMPPMDAGMNQGPMMGGEQEQPMGDEPMMDDNGFDAGVDADPESDPKKYIQQLSGKLSQELRSYNQEQGTPDTDLNKYVAGMVIPQATKSMTDDDKKDVINKINKGVTDDDMNDGSDGADMGGGEMPMESRFSLDNIINEIMGSVLNQDEDYRDREEKKITNKKVTNKNPFVSNR